MACAACLLLLATVRSRADPKLQGSGEASVGYTDNVRTTPDSPGAAQGSPRSQGAFLMLSPGLVLAYESARAVQRLGYRFEYDIYFTQSAASSASNRLEYRGLFDLAPRALLVLGASVNESDRFSSVSFAPPGAGLANVLPADGGAFLQANADQLFSLDIAPLWRAYQGAAATFETPIFGTEGPRTWAVAGRLGAERSFIFDAIGAEARTDYSVVRDGVASDGSPAGVQRQLVSGGVARWRRDWGRYLTSSLEAGAVRVQRLDSGRGFWSPAGAAMLAYAQEHGDAQLSYAHTVTTNPLIGQSLLVDEVRLRGGVPLLREEQLALAASAGYQHGRLIDEDATLAARIDVFLLDVSLGWQATKSLGLGLRYQHVRQMSDALAPPLPLSFIQNNVLLGAVLKFPPEQDMPRPYRAPRRVDRSDEIRDGIRPPEAGPRAPGELTR